MFHGIVSISQSNCNLCVDYIILHSFCQMVFYIFLIIYGYFLSYKFRQNLKLLYSFIIMVLNLDKLFAK